MSATPLSDLITQLVAEPSDAAFAKFIASFVVSSVGVVVTGTAANRSPGETFQVGPSDKLNLQLVDTPDGRKMIKACADPDAFVMRHPETQITACIVGRNALQMLLQLPSVDGILVCSAASFHSVPISRNDAQRVLTISTTPDRTSKPWWKRWRR